MPGGRRPSGRTPARLPFSDWSRRRTGSAGGAGRFANAQHLLQFVRICALKRIAGQAHIQVHRDADAELRGVFRRIANGVVDVLVRQLAVRDAQARRQDREPGVLGDHVDVRGEDRVARLRPDYAVCDPSRPCRVMAEIAEPVL